MTSVTAFKTYPCPICDKPVPIYNVLTIKKEWKEMKGICEPCYKKQMDRKYNTKEKDKK